MTRVWKVTFGSMDNVNVVAPSLDAALSKGKEYRAEAIKGEPRDVVRDYAITSIELLAESNWGA